MGLALGRLFGNNLTRLNDYAGSSAPKNGISYSDYERTIDSFAHGLAQAAFASSAAGPNIKIVGWSYMGFERLPKLLDFTFQEEFYGLASKLLDMSGAWTNNPAKMQEMVAWIHISKNGIFRSVMASTTGAISMHVDVSMKNPFAGMSGVTATLHTHPMHGIEVPGSGGLVGAPFPSGDDLSWAKAAGVPGISVSSKGTVWAYDGAGCGAECPSRPSP